MAVLTLADAKLESVARLLEKFGLELVLVPIDKDIPASYWGEQEAGLLGKQVYARMDTPIHSILHEASHTICMSPQRRGLLNTNAGGDDNEENAACYLQVLLSDELDYFRRDRMFSDMDEWGYSFRLGSSRRWFYEDAADERRWLQRNDLVDHQDRLTWRLRGVRAS